MKREPRNQPFTWQEKKVLRIIKNNFEGSDRYRLLCLYLILTWMDNDFNGSSIKYYTKSINTYSGLSIDWIPKGLKTLEKLKIIRIEEVRNEKGNYNGRYIVFTPQLIEDTPKKVEPVNEESANGFDGTLEQSIFKEQNTIQNTPVSNPNQLAETKKEEKAVDEKFNEFWDLYPKKVERKTAKSKYNKIINNGIKHKDIIIGLNKYIEEIKNRKLSKEYIKYPTTWLNGECWNNEYEVSLTKKRILDTFDYGEATL